MAQQIRLKRGLSANLPVGLAIGELAFTTDTYKLYVGSADGNKEITKDTIVVLDVTNSTTTPRYVTGKFLKEQLLDKIPIISTDIDTDASSDVKTASPKAVKDYVLGKVAGLMKLKGNLAPGGLVAGLLVKANEGNVYNINSSFTTDALFTEGSGKSYPAGTNVGIVDAGGGAYLFDAMTGIIDTSSFLTAVPQATELALGGIKAKAKSSETVEVAIDGASGKLYVPTYPTDTDTKNTAGSSQDSAKLFIVGAKSQGTNPQTYSNVKVYIENDKLYSDNAVVLTAVPQATTSLTGGIKVNYTTSTPKHKVELDGSGNAFVDLTNLTIDGGEWD